MTTAKPTRRWFQYSLRTLLVFVTLCAFACSWLAVKLKQARRQREATVALRGLGGQIIYDWEITTNGGLELDPKPTGPLWLRHALGNDFRWKVIWVAFRDLRVSGDLLKHLKGLPHLQRLYFLGKRPTDEDIKTLRQALPTCQISRWNDLAENRRKRKENPAAIPTVHDLALNERPTDRHNAGE
jgi:hypothetical protein